MATRYATPTDTVAGRAFTPEFAAPEQLAGGLVTTATDVHALGTLAYLLLSGAHPAAAPGATPSDLLRAIVERDPIAPSEAATADAASARGASVDGLRRELRGDLDTIVAKALKKDPAERYPSVDAVRPRARSSPAAAGMSSRTVKSGVSPQVAQPDRRRTSSNVSSRPAP